MVLFQIGSVYRFMSRNGFRSGLSVCAEAILVSTSLLAAFAIWLAFHLHQTSLLWPSAPILLLIRLLLFPTFKLIPRAGRHIPMREALKIGRTVGLGSLLFFLVARLILKAALPLSIYFFEALLTTFLLLCLLLFLSRPVAAVNGGEESPSRLPETRGASEAVFIRALSDLLGREPVNLNFEVIREQIEGRVIMVTGAAGSIGSELCAQILEYDPLLLVCLDQNENGIFFLELALKKHRNATRIVYKVADVCNAVRVQRILRECAVRVIFHAAAYKHVPVMERNLPEALSNNVFGLMNILALADDTGCESFVMISSDKAVNPTNVMGATKRIGELIVASRPSKMRCVSVRFGNVLGSNGSVVPILQQQIREAGEMTITHPEIKRFFMTIGEAVSLVLQAFTVGDQGDLLVLDMGQPIRIIDLARALVRLNGKAESEVPIRITGLREGEKLHEELLYASEEIFPTTCEKINRIKSKLLKWSDLSILLHELESAMRVESDLEVRARIQHIIPEYSGAQPAYLKARARSG